MKFANTLWRDQWIDVFMYCYISEPSIYMYNQIHGVSSIKDGLFEERSKMIVNLNEIRESSPVLMFEWHNLLNKVKLSKKISRIFVTAYGN